MRISKLRFNSPNKLRMKNNVFINTNTLRIKIALRIYPLISIT